MKTSKLIEELTLYMEKYGDLPVVLDNDKVRGLWVLDNEGHNVEWYPEYKAEVFYII